MSRISQREARRLRKRVDELEQSQDKQRRAWAQDYPGGVHIGTINCAGIDADTRVAVARKLGHAVVVVNQDGDKLAMFALPLPVKP